MKRLIVVRGPMGAGKTTLCQVLLPYLQPAFWLDGDWCWKMEPFTADEAMREMVMENISFLLGQFLRAEGKDNVLFSWVLHEDAILEDLLHRLSSFRFSLHVFNLEPGEKALVERLRGISPGAHGRKMWCSGPWSGEGITPACGESTWTPLSSPRKRPLV